MKKMEEIVAPAWEIQWVVFFQMENDFILFVAIG